MRRWIKTLNIVIPLALLGAFAWHEGRAWLERHPEHSPWAPLTLDQPDGWATAAKIAELRSDPAECRAVTARSAIALTELPAQGEGACYRPDRTLLPAGLAPLTPARADATCAVNFALLRWLRQEVEPAARELLGSEVSAVEHYGTYSCRPIRGGGGRMSQHAQGNAIDIAAFTLKDGRQISVLRDWPGQGGEGAFLRRVRDGACKSFGTVLSPDYNADHADHLHLDQAPWQMCR